MQALRQSHLATPPRSRRRARIVPTSLSKRTNDPLAHVNMNTARGRRIADLARCYLEAAGDTTDIARQAAIVKAAELETLAEEARNTALSAPGVVDLDQVVRVQNLADRALRAIGRIKTRKPAGQGLAGYMAGLATGK